MIERVKEHTMYVSKVHKPYFDGTQHNAAVNIVLKAFLFWSLLGSIITDVIKIIHNCDW